ncbi:MAG: hydroxylamine reductase, partial [Desulfobacterales bacterium]|nr:hydroxylamine reductase [Desulfobacterales bacterium]
MKRKENIMFCYQCEQTAKGTGCTVQGVCGKSPEIAALQDLLLYSLMGLSQVAVEGRKVGVSDNDVNVFTVQASFSTLTNVDFDPDRFMDLIRQSTTLREKLKTQVESVGGNVDWSDGPTTFQPKNSLDDLVKQGEQVGIKSYPSDDPD